MCLKCQLAACLGEQLFSNEISTTNCINYGPLLCHLGLGGGGVMPLLSVYSRVLVGTTGVQFGQNYSCTVWPVPIVTKLAQF